MGQGAAMAIEDAVGIATLLPCGTLNETVPSRLQIYEISRRPRVDLVLHFTRANAANENDPSRPRISGQFASDL